MYTDRTAPATLRRRVLRWYGRSARDLPWRRTRDPYAVLVSEVMLQQTGVARVLPAYTAFLRRFPTLAALSRATLADVLRAWSGLGYNRRARDLHRIARLHPRALPPTREALDALPGVGAYTAGAVTCFTRGESVAFADTNIRRVLGRLLLGRIATEREAVALDERLLPRRAPDRWHHALMDLGATVCLARTPRCEVCPIADACRSRGRVVPAAARPQAAFGASDRRVRGRIVAALRDAPDGLGPAELRRVVGDDRVARLTLRLEAEGLLARTPGRVRLSD
ncbi:MAG TPA: A/G-specific adenine glycosylase [Candidatus Limnocylindria bacterium]|nr:A/G-specific adenine glycosylase [Candidatus Limnocylindria bacterium]